MTHLKLRLGPAKDVLKIIRALNEGKFKLPEFEEVCFPFKEPYLFMSLMCFSSSHLEHLEPPPAKRSRPEFDNYNPQQPSIGSVSPSQVNSTKISSITSAGRIYSHWLALELYNLSLSSLSTKGTIKNFEVELPSVKDIVAAFQRVSKLPTESFSCGILSDTLIRDSEITSTTILQRELDRFLFNGDKTQLGACYHQFPTNCDNSSHSPQRPDFYVVSLSNLLPSRAIAVSDFKSSADQKAHEETIAFSTTVMKKKYFGNCFVTHLAFPATRQTITLQVHIAVNRRLIVIEVYKANVLDTTAVETFFKVFYTAVHFLIHNPISSSLPCISPINSLSLNIPLTNNPSQTVPCRVFLDDDEKYVYKLYDTNKDSFNEKLSKLLLPEAEMINLSQDQRFKCLKYKYLRGGHTAKNDIQFCDVLKQLQQIHDMGYCHSDIRSVNLVFGEDGRNAWIIDFDLADLEGKRYPETFNHADISERHKSAVPCGKRSKSHDCWALSVIMKKNGVHNDFVISVRECRDLNEVAKSLFSSVKQTQKK